MADFKPNFYQWLMVAAVMVPLAVVAFYQAKETLDFPLMLKQYERGTPARIRSFGCGLPTKDGHQYASVQQGAMTLKFPQTEEVGEVYRLNDIKDGCIPNRFRIRLFWYQGQLLSSDEYEALAALPNAPYVENINRYTVYLRFKGLDMPANLYQQQLFDKSTFDEAERYTPSFEHRVLPLTYHPNFFAKELSEGHAAFDTPYSIKGSHSIITGLPIRVSCNITSITDSKDKSALEDALTTRMMTLKEWGGSHCQGVDAVEKNGQYLKFAFDVDPDAVVDLDKIHQAMLTRVKSYIQE